MTRRTNRLSGRFLAVVAGVLGLAALAPASALAGQHSGQREVRVVVSDHDSIGEVSHNRRRGNSCDRSRGRDWDRGRDRGRDRGYDRGRGNDCDRGRGQGSGVRVEIRVPRVIIIGGGSSRGGGCR